MPDTLITPAPEIAILAETLIRQHAPELLECTILSLFTSADAPCKPRLCNPLLRYLASLHLAGAPRAAVDEGPDALLLINAEEWSYLLPGQQEPFLLHRILHLGREEKSDGGVRFVIRPHSLEEFSQIIQAYGLYSAAAKELGRLLQPELDFAVHEISTQNRLG